ncbi:MAG: hypothetical protein HZB76_00590 [Chlamydiae bacterium]|nr:hypothetical protein [Chlamydiota bacterium]
MPITTQDYLTKIAPTMPFSKRTMGYIEKIGYFIYSHETVVKVIKLGLMAIGLVATALSLVYFPALGMGKTIAIASSGAVFSLGTYVFFKVLNVIAPFKHDMRSHAYKPQKCLGGEIRYENDVPIVEINEDVCKTPYETGKVYGTLIAPQMQELRKRANLGPNLINPIENFFRRKLLGLPSVERLEKYIQIAKKEIPQRYLEELQGMVDAFNTWAKEHNVKSMSMDEALYFHMLADWQNLIFFDPSKDQTVEDKTAKKTSGPIAACSVVVADDPTGKPFFARKLDWLSFGVAGQLSHALYRRRNGEIKSVEFTVPGLLWTLSGTNKEGLKVAMNVSLEPKQSSPNEGIPSTCLNRLILDECSTIDDVEKLLTKYKPLVPYHLTVVDKDNAKIFHMKQVSKSLDEKFVKEGGYSASVLKKDDYLVQTNRSQAAKKASQDWLPQRLANIKAIIKDAGEKVGKDLDESLVARYCMENLAWVTYYDSLHSLVMLPSGEVEVCYDNAYAGLHKLGQKINPFRKNTSN